jgi:putative transcriptional regulator
MTSRAFDKIAEGLNEALAIARGSAEPARLHVPPEMNVRAIRAKTSMAQEQFASAFGFSVHQVRQWEQGRHRPLGAMRAYLMVIDRDPESVLALLREASETQRVA